MMAVITSAFLVIAFFLAFLLGPQTRPWSWGPAMVPLSLATLSAMITIWRDRSIHLNLSWVALGVAVCGWFSLRAIYSPVWQFGQSDGLLLCVAVGVFLSVLTIPSGSHGEKVLIWGLAMLLLANGVVAVVQVISPGYMLLFLAPNNTTIVSGFFAHYNEAANYFIAAAMIIGAASLLGNYSSATRIVFALIAIMGLIALIYTRSRGGILAGAIAIAAFSFFALILGKKKNAKWFAPAVVALPIVVIGLVCFLAFGWQSAQAVRMDDPSTAKLLENDLRLSVSTLLDNQIRLFLYNIVLSCIFLHPWYGGGSHSFSWECNRFWDIEAFNFASHRPEFVHNELLQAITDYGIIGGLLLVILLGVWCFTCLIKTFYPRQSSLITHDDAWRIGGLCALLGMFVQSNFSFVFHSLPGVFSLGCCLAQMLRSNSSVSQPSQVSYHACKLSLIVCGAASFICLLAMGVKGTIVCQSLLPLYFKNFDAISISSRLACYESAIKVWPSHDLHSEKAALLQQIAKSPELAANHPGALESALRQYQFARKLHPYDPASAVNLANLLSYMGQNQAAEAAFEEALNLQGNMEQSYQAGMEYASHLLRKGQNSLSEKSYDEARRSLESSIRLSENAVKNVNMWTFVDQFPLKLVAIYESYGLACEGINDLNAALRSYHLASEIPLRPKPLFYRMGVVYGKLGKAAWEKRRSAEALGYFIEAKNHIDAAAELPQGVTPSMKLDYQEYLNDTIRFLKGAKITPIMPKRLDS
ncbi:MAG: hypothetical protein EAZ42_06730 [Verrucomicrobia bacterium]|nr:MAG: hypothetical protein EAZ42_06730 [Verrucomicrobiota bacterium]